MYKKIYLEVTNNCNLNCDFCIKNNRDKLFIDIDDFSFILNKIKNYTNYLYFHVMGEPLLHPKINELINIASKDFKVNITTNGYLINRIKGNRNIRQINISLHSFDERYNVSLDDYLNNIFSSVDSFKDVTYVSYRFWIDNKNNNEIIKLINEYYDTDIVFDSSKGSVKVIDNVFISFNEEFIWPSYDNDYYNEVGTCYALRDHIGILVDGSIVPCCLDSNANILLGNIYKDEMDDIINGKRYQNMLFGFKNNLKEEEFCRKCNFIKNN